LQLPEIQKRIGSEFGVQMTYMEVKLLLADLRLVPKDPAEPAPAAKALAAAPAAPAPSAPRGRPADKGKGTPARPAETPRAAAEGVSVSVDRVARPGALVSGGVTFSDGQTAAWYMDQAGRLAVMPAQQGYKPSAVDVQEFQMALESQLARLGF
jgi:hypothetical protein